MTLPSLCPKCHRPFEAFQRGLVAAPLWRRMLRQQTRCLICRGCKEIVGYE